MNAQTKAKIQKQLKNMPHVRSDSYFREQKSSEKTAINPWPWLIVLCLLLITVFILKLGHEDIDSSSIQNNDYILKAQQASQTTNSFDLPPPSIPNTIDYQSPVENQNPNPLLKTQPLTLANEQLVKPGDDSVFLNDGDAETEENVDAEIATQQ